jgi:hypothetical protein
MTVNCITREQGYLIGVVSVLVRLLLAMSLALLPAGMAVPAGAAVPSASIQCTDHGQPMHDALDLQWHCTACAVIPASEPPPAGLAILPRPLLTTFSPAFTVGSEPEVATPPPKNACVPPQVNPQHL